MNKANTDWLVCNLTKARLSAIDDIVAFNISSDNQDFNQIIMHTLKMGGKKLRPSLYLLSLTTGNYYDKELLHPAAALELIHIASLYHDDIMDQAELRRNVLSVNAQWGNIDATYSGNYLFSKAISILSAYDKKINLITCHYVSDLCLGQLKETENAYNLQISIDQHIDIIRKKTASLFVLPCKLGVTLAGAAPHWANALSEYGENIGIAFQIIDDILDLKGDSPKTGKKQGTDLKEGIYTYPTIIALASENGSGELADLLVHESLDDVKINRAIQIIEARKGIEQAQLIARDYINKALSSVSTLPDTSSKKSFINLANFIIDREK